MTFRQAVQATPSVSAHYKPGLQALAASHRALIRTSSTRALDGSVNLDEAFRAHSPNDPRWDYGIGVTVGRQGGAIWIEVHPASCSRVGHVLAKLDWLQKWLQAAAPALKGMTLQYVWVATGTVALQATAPQRRVIAQRGLLLKARVLSVDDLLR